MNKNQHKINKKRKMKLIYFLKNRLIKDQEYSIKEYQISRNNKGIGIP